MHTSVVQKASLYTMKDYAGRSRNNEAESTLLAIYDADHIKGAFHMLATHPERCLLILELSDGREINIYPSLKAEATAMNEPPKDSEPLYPWETKLDIWPMASVAKTDTSGFGPYGKIG